MLRKHYAITTDVARVYKLRLRGPRRGWGWAIATIREWPGGGQIDVQSDHGSYAYTWTAIGDRTLREFLCGLHFDYFMNKAAPNRGKVFDEEKTIRSIKAAIFEAAADGSIDRDDAHDWRDEVDECGDAGSEHLFADRLMRCDCFHRLYRGDYPTMKMMDCPRARAFWDGPWQALCAHWRRELQVSSSTTEQSAEAA